MGEGPRPDDAASSDTQPMATPPPDAAVPPPPASPPAETAPMAAQAAAPMAAPAAAPAAAAPPVAWAAPSAAAATTRGGRTTLAAVAGIAMLVLGIIGVLIGIAVIVFGGVVGSLDLSQFTDTTALGDNAAKVISGVVVFAGIIVLVYSAFYVIGGVGVLRSRDWGRVTGIVVGIISGLIWLTGLSNDRGSILFALVLFLVHAYIVVVLAVRWRERVPAAGA